MIEITENLIFPEWIIDKVRSNSSCVVTYIGLIRDQSQGRGVLSIGTRTLREMPWLMVRFYLCTNPLRAFGMFPVALNLLRHGRLSFKAEKLTPEGAKQLRAIIDKAESLGGVA
jgi:hypothetical protein